MLAAANNASAGGTDAGDANQTNNGAPMALARKALDVAMETSTTSGAIGAVLEPKKEAIAQVNENENLLHNPTKRGNFAKPTTIYFSQSPS